jgi:hypothetical protein
MTNIRQILLDRLTRQGLDLTDMEPFLRDLTLVLSAIPGIDSVTANVKLQVLGWNGVKLDYQSIQLALAWFEYCGKNDAGKKVAS